MLAIPATASASYLTNGRLTLTHLGGHFGPITDLVSPPGQPNTLWVLDQDGVIVARGPGGSRHTVLDLRTSVAYTGAVGDERGLLAAAFPSDYRQTRTYYVYFTAPRLDDPDGSILTLASVTAGQVHVIVTFPHENLDDHNGGDLMFGPGGDLYLSIGDGSGVEDSDTTSQNPASPLGKLMRIDPADGAYQILDQGLRNPWRFAFDPPTHSLWLTDVGEARWESIYRVPEDSSGLNFGWPMCEGNHSFDPANLTAPTGPCTAPGVTPPTFEYPHTEGCAVIGGFVVRDPRFRGAEEDLRGRYVFADYCTGQLWSMGGAFHAARKERRLGVNAVTTFGQDSDGRIYMGSGQGQIFRIDPVRKPTRAGHHGHRGTHHRSRAV